MIIAVVDWRLKANLVVLADLSSNYILLYY